PGQGGHGGRARLGELAHRMLADSWALVTKQPNQFVRAELVPSQLQAHWIVWMRSTDPPNPVNRAQYVRLGELRGGATELIPATCVDDEQAAIGIFEDIGRMEVSAVRNHKITVFGFEGGTIGLNHVAGNFVHVEAADEQVIPILVTKNARIIAD